jgi:hypothetical protein
MVYGAEINSYSELQLKAVQRQARAALGLAAGVGTEFMDLLMPAAGDPVLQLTAATLIREWWVLGLVMELLPTMSSVARSFGPCRASARATNGTHR